MNSWLLACHHLQDGFGQITLPFYSDDDLHAFLWQCVVVIGVVLTSQCYLASTRDSLHPKSLVGGMCLAGSSLREA